MTIVFFIHLRDSKPCSIANTVYFICWQPQQLFVPRLRDWISGITHSQTGEKVQLLAAWSHLWPLLLPLPPSCLHRCAAQSPELDTRMLPGKWEHWYFFQSCHCYWEKCQLNVPFLLFQSKFSTTRKIQSQWKGYWHLLFKTA